MSEPIPGSVPTSASFRARPAKKKVALTPASQQSAQVEALFANPERAGNGINVGPRPKTLAAAPEIVASVQGSSAGAGSGEFHVYKASRRREYERLRVMDEETKAEEADKEYQERKQERERADAEKLRKNQAKRAKLKQRQQKSKLGPSGTANVEDNGPTAKKSGVVATSLKRNLEAANIASPNGTANDTPEPELSHDDNGHAVEEAGITIHDDD